MHAEDGVTRYVDDVRQSPDGDAVMLRYYNWLIGQQSTTIVPSPAGGAPLSQGEIPSDVSLPSPQFFHVSDDLYFIVSGDEIGIYQRDGDAQTPYTVDDPTKSGILLRHFAVAPDDETWAAVVDVGPGSFASLPTGTFATGTELWIGTFSDGVLASYEFGSFYFPNELVWHPDGQGVFLDLSQYGTAYYTLQDDDGTYVDQRWLPVEGMHHVDVNRVDGRILLLITGFLQTDLVTGGKIDEGLYVGPADATDFDQVDTPDLGLLTSARWVQSWRHQPGQYTSRVR
jgi:hypothetical protein